MALQVTRAARERPAVVSTAARTSSASPRPTVAPVARRSWRTRVARSGRRGRCGGREVGEPLPGAPGSSRAKATYRPNGIDLQRFRPLDPHRTLWAARLAERRVSRAVRRKKRRRNEARRPRSKQRRAARRARNPRPPARDGRRTSLRCAGLAERQRRPATHVGARGFAKHRQGGARLRPSGCLRRRWRRAGAPERSREREVCEASPPRIAEALQRVAANPGRRGGRTSVAELSLERTAAALRALYERCRERGALARA